ncbi:hypothetical protein NEIRO03_2521 [Nematocida sp. AWRm78]|nr:hypothetical protein NEIRO02_2508 [Nematocida sp. AWRm79]KAI5187364.1 hypothetical protein NEIRO03_2521 [Nematocida sp. AWRm78]
MPSLTLVCLSDYTSVYSFVSTLENLESVLLVDLECECDFDQLKVDTLYTLEFLTDFPKDKSILVLNRIDSFISSPYDLQVRLNGLYGLVYSGVTVYATLIRNKYNKYNEYIARMIDKVIEYKQAEL